MRVRTIADHKKSLADLRANFERRMEAQMEDAALSEWGDACRGDGDRFAIQLLERGVAECGKEIPMDDFRFLVDADGNDVDANEIVTRDGRIVWILGDDAAARYGRKFIPVGEKSRVQRQLGLKEEWRVAEASPYIKGYCGWIGGIMTYRAKRANKDMKAGA